MSYFEPAEPPEVVYPPAALARRPDENTGRARKALRLFDACLRLRIDSTRAARLDADGRSALATLAGCRPPSEQTWSLVVDGLRDHERETG